MTPDACRLPPELTDYAIDFLHDDAPTLRAVAIASKSTLPSARYHLFHAAQLHTVADLDKLAALVTANPHLSPYIQCLTLSKAAKTSGRATPGRISTVDTSSAWETTLDTSVLPQSLPALRTLHINHFLSFWQPASFSIVSYSAFKTVQTLHVSDSSLRSFTELRLLLAALPDVRALVLDGVGIGMKSEDLTWLHDIATGISPEKDDAEAQRQQIFDGTRTPPDLRQHAQTLFKDPVALTSLRIAYRSSSAEAFSPTLSLNALSVLLSYLLTTPSMFSLTPKDVHIAGFDSLGEEFTKVIKGFRDALVKARNQREDWV